jgi:glutaminase
MNRLVYRAGGLRHVPADVGRDARSSGASRGSSRVPGRDVHERVDRRLQDLYDRHRDVELSDIATFYEPGRGYCGVDLTSATHDQFAIALVTTDGELQSVGDDDAPFALQSVSKVFVYGLALEDHGREHVLERVGVEPSGDAFNSIVFDERHDVRTTRWSMRTRS